ncbi:hypothetical protein [Nocardia sp. alder85J]|uniref:hypothetical protein n=1 Tax=Nocardia sp. alder85J TaxID=2862949 RepID=UPI001CD67E38|nr:hypothetical protein [Nocardia sp. alder85J]MCX4097943.1 hypothetical protein [Nocardia sp. alder85J]
MTGADVLVGISTVGQAGRVVDRTLMRKLGWAPGTRLRIRIADAGVLVVERDTDGPVIVRGSGCFAIPYRMRRRVNLFVGDRVLLLGRVTRGRLAIHPPAAIDTLFTTSFDLLEDVSR